MLAGNHVAASLSEGNTRSCRQILDGPRDQDYRGPSSNTAETKCK